MQQDPSRQSVPTGSESPAQSVLILGGSARSAAFSALRAGLNPICGDVFADRDLVARCSVMRLPMAQYPRGLELLARAAPPAPWLYCGGLENWPDLVESISSHRALWGNSAAVLARVRDPFEVTRCLQEANLPHLDVRPGTDQVPPDGHWLVKPVAGAGGRGIEEYTGQPLDHQQRAESYFQQRVAGDSYAALYVGNGRDATLIGLTRQLVGEAEFHARPFHYCGSIGPMEVPDDIVHELKSTGSVLAAEFNLVGIFGIDVILANGQLWLVEINPRYTASAEVLELALGVPVLALHSDACTAGRLPADIREVSGYLAMAPRYLGKGILFARSRVAVPDLGGELVELAGVRSRWPIVLAADVPGEGEQVAATRPICSVFAAHDSVQGCYDDLIEVARRIFELVGDYEQAE